MLGHSLPVYDVAVMNLFAQFIETVPGWLRLLIAIALTVGITLACVRLLHNRILEMNDEDEEDEVEDEVAAAEAAESEADGPASDETKDKPTPTPKAPASHYLAGRVISLVGVAFVFLFAFCVNNFWTNNHDARTAVESEMADLTRISALAQGIGGPSGQQLSQALDAYRKSVILNEWPLMQDGDVHAAAREHEKSSLAVARAVEQAGAEGATKSMSWSSITKAVDDMLDQGKTRTTSLPPPAAPGVVTLIFILGITNLGLTAAYQPARIGQNMFLMGLMAAITALMFFIVVEASNPYLGSGAIGAGTFSP